MVVGYLRRQAADINGNGNVIFVIGKLLLAITVAIRWHENDSDDAHLLFHSCQAQRIKKKNMTNECSVQHTNDIFGGVEYPLKMLKLCK